MSRGNSHLLTGGSDIEALEMAERDAGPGARDSHRSAKEEDLSIHANLTKIVEHHAEECKKLERRFEDSENRAHALVVHAQRLIAEHQATVEQFNKTTRRIALSAFVMVMVLLILMELSWWAA